MYFELKKNINLGLFFALLCGVTMTPNIAFAGKKTKNEKLSKDEKLPEVTKTNPQDSPEDENKNKNGNGSVEGDSQTSSNKDENEQSPKDENKNGNGAVKNDSQDSPIEDENSESEEEELDENEKIGFLQRIKNVFKGNTSEYHDLIDRKPPVNARILAYIPFSRYSEKRIVKRFFSVENKENLTRFKRMKNFVFKCAGSDQDPSLERAIIGLATVLRNSNKKEALGELSSMVTTRDEEYEAADNKLKGSLKELAKKEGIIKE